MNGERYRRHVRYYSHVCALGRRSTDTHDHVLKNKFLNVSSIYALDGPAACAVLPMPTSLAGYVDLLLPRTNVESDHKAQAIHYDMSNTKTETVRYPHMCIMCSWYISRRHNNHVRTLDYDLRQVCLTSSVSTPTLPAVKASMPHVVENDSNDTDDFCTHDTQCARRT
jgi:hypothetical protein